MSIPVDGFRVQSRGDHGWLLLACGILSSSSDIEGCRGGVVLKNKLNGHQGEVCETVYNTIQHNKLYFT